MLTHLFMILLVLAPGLGSSQISDSQKQEFLNLLKVLPSKGEFYTDDAISKAGPYLPVLLALTEKDIEEYDLYPFLAVSRGLCDHQEHRDFAIRNFSTIKHPTLKLFWAVILFDSKEGSSADEIHQFLKDALASKEQSKMLSEMIGPEFESFRSRVLSPSIRKKN
jgi:hypothetical protein